jgi:hypothetical protein
MTLAIADAHASWDLLRIECACRNKLRPVQANRLSVRPKLACSDPLRMRHSINGVDGSASAHLSLHRATAISARGAGTRTKWCIEKINSADPSFQTPARTSSSPSAAADVVRFSPSSRRSSSLGYRRACVFSAAGGKRQNQRQDVPPGEEECRDFHPAVTSYWLWSLARTANSFRTGRCTAARF